MGKCGGASEPAFRWIIDCGATRHCVPDRAALAAVTLEQPAVRVRVADGTKHQVQCVGTVELSVYDASGAVVLLRLSDVLVVPGLDARLFSCGHGYYMDGISTYLNNKRSLRTRGGAIIPFERAGHGRSLLNYSIAVVDQPQIVRACADEVAAVSSAVKHARLGHFSELRVKSARGRSTGLDLSGYAHDRLACDACLRNASRKGYRPGGGGGVPSSKAEPKELGDPRWVKFGECVDSDLCGPFPKSIISHFSYAIVFVDRSTRMVATYYLQDKAGDSVLSAFKQFLADHATYLAWNRGRVVRWHTDNGGEFQSTDLNEFCVELCVNRSYSVPYSPPSNAAAERAWATVLRPTRVMLAACGLPDGFWPFAMHHAVRVHNSLPTRGHVPPKSPIEALTGKLPDLGRFRVFGCRCFIHLEGASEADQPKLASTSVEGVHLGIDPKRNGYIVYIPALERLTTARNVDFQEERFVNLGNEVELDGRRSGRDEVPGRPARSTRREPAPSATATDPAPNGPAPETSTSSTNGNVPSVPRVKLKLRVPTASSVATNANADEVASASSSTSNPSPTSRRVLFKALLFSATHCSWNSIKWAASYVSNCFVAQPDAGPIPIPKSYAEAMRSPHAQQWRDACLEEVQGKMGHNRAWDLIRRSDVPAGRRVLKGKWVFAVKYNVDGTVRRFKARWVGCGYSQREGEDFFETYASTLRAASFRLIIAVAAVFNLSLRHIDVTKAFTQAPLDDVRLYVEQPTGFGEPGKVCKLRMALEGLKQSAHLWQNLCAAFLVELGFARLEHEPCIFRRGSVDKNTIIVLGVFVDDVVCAFSDLKCFRAFETAFASRFKCTPSVELEQYMGVAITRDWSAGTVSISQQGYVTAMADKYLVGVHTKLWNGPVGSSREELDAFDGLQGATTEAERVAMSAKDYMSLVGSLLWCACMTRPDVAYHCAVLGRFMQDPSPRCLEAAQGVLGYLVKTSHYTLTYGGPILERRFNVPDSALGLHMWFDSSWGKVPQPMCGHVIFVANAPVSWAARKMKCIPLSTCEAEYVAGSHASRDLSFVRHILDELNGSAPGERHFGPTPATPTMTDSKSARDVVEHVGVTARTRHYARWMHHLRQMVQSLCVSMHLVPTSEMLADCFTKALGRGDVMRAARVFFRF